MTGRQALKRANLLYVGSCVAGMVVGTAIVAVGLAIESWRVKHGLASSNAIFFGSFAIGFAFFIVGVFSGHWFLRCPWCRGNWSAFASQLLHAERVKYCPYCAKVLDEELPINKSLAGKRLKNPKSKQREWDEDLV